MRADSIPFSRLFLGHCSLQGTVNLVAGKRENRALYLLSLRFVSRISRGIPCVYHPVFRAFPRFPSAQENSPFVRVLFRISSNLSTCFLCFSNIPLCLAEAQYWSLKTVTRRRQIFAKINEINQEEEPVSLSRESTFGSGEGFGRLHAKQPESHLSVFSVIAPEFCAMALVSYFQPGNSFFNPLVYLSAFREG